jgi:hypothetical protein
MFCKKVLFLVKGIVGNVNCVLSNRRLLSDKLAKMRGRHFLYTCLTTVKTAQEGITQFSYPAISKICQGCIFLNLFSIIQQLDDLVVTPTELSLGIKSQVSTKTFRHFVPLLGVQGRGGGRRSCGEGLDYSSNHVLSLVTESKDVLRSSRKL